MCGEKPSDLDRKHRTQGSPPRVRGKAGFDRWYLAVLGITPACAGKSFQQDGERQADLDHPRVCGEKHSTNVLAPED